MVVDCGFDKIDRISPKFRLISPASIIVVAASLQIVPLTLASHKQNPTHCRLFAKKVDRDREIIFQ